MKLRLDDVVFSYRRRHETLSHVDFEIESGLTLLLGPNGSGKSTLLRLAAGIERPDEGRILVGDVDLWEQEVEARRSIAYFPEYPDITPYANIAEVLTLVCRLRGVDVSEVERLLSLVGLEGLEARSVRQLSLGQRRRALLAAAWIGEPSLLLLDEPFEAMDRVMRDTNDAWIDTRRDAGATIVLATHLLEPLVERVDRVLAIGNGKVVLHEAPARDLAFLAALARGD